MTRRRRVNVLALEAPSDAAHIVQVLADNAESWMDLRLEIDGERGQFMLTSTGRRPEPPLPDDPGPALAATLAEGGRE